MSMRYLIDTDWAIHYLNDRPDIVQRLRALQDDGLALFQVAYLDLRAGRTAEDWQPCGVRVEETAGVGSAEQRLREQDQDGCAAEVLFPNMQAGPGLWRNIADDAAISPRLASRVLWSARFRMAWPTRCRRRTGSGPPPWTCRWP